MAVPLYKTNYLSWGEENSLPQPRGFMFYFLSEKEVDHADMFAIYAGRFNLSNQYD